MFSGVISGLCVAKSFIWQVVSDFNKSKAELQVKEPILRTLHSAKPIYRHHKLNQRQQVENRKSRQNRKGNTNTAFKTFQP